MPDRFGNDAWNCERCPEQRPLGVRRSLHCGYLDESEWTECTLPTVLGNSGINPRAVGVCPGWLRRQPGVTDALEAYALLRHNEIPEGHAMNEAALLTESAFRLWEAWISDEENRKRQAEQAAKG